MPAHRAAVDAHRYTNTQAKERHDIVNVGGFSDQVFNLIAAVASGKAGAGYWTREIDRTPLPGLMKTGAA